MKKNKNNSLFLQILNGQSQSVIGILNPIQWSKNGEVKEFSIYSEDEEDIIIEGYRNKNKLRKLLNKNVLAKGKIRIDNSGEKYKRINRTNCSRSKNFYTLMGRFL